MRVGGGGGFTFPILERKTNGMVVVVSLGESMVVVSLNFHFLRETNKGGDGGFKFSFFEGESKHIVMAGVIIFFNFS